MKMVSKITSPREENKQLSQNPLQTLPNKQQHQQDEEVILWRPKRAPQVCIEGYVDMGVGSDEDELPRTKSLTDEDLDELKGCLDLGFGFNYDEIPELCNTLPALELCYSMSQKFLIDDHKDKDCGDGSGLDSGSNSGSDCLINVPTWKISSPGDNPEDVKARLKFWAQAVACTVKLCS